MPLLHGLIRDMDGETGLASTENKTSGGVDGASPGHQLSNQYNRQGCL